MEQTKKDLIKVKEKKKYLYVIILVILVVDQVIKITLSAIGDVTVIPNVFQLHIVQNTQGTYGVNSDSTILYIFTNIIVLGIVFRFLRMENQFVDTKLKIFLSFVLAGGISNLIDRLVRGYVLEYIDFTKVIPIPVLNLADIFIAIGWICIVARFASFTVKEWRKNKEEKIRKNEKEES